MFEKKKEEIKNKASSVYIAYTVMTIAGAAIIFTAGVVFGAATCCPK